MPLSEEEKARIREIETIRAEVQQEVQRRYRASLVGTCHSCGRWLQINWRYCPFCGAPPLGVCSRCHVALPAEEGAQFCYLCGQQVLGQGSQTKRSNLVAFARKGEGQTESR